MAHSHTPRTSCVRFAFGIAAALRNTRFQARPYLADLHRLIAPASWRLPSFDHLVGAGEERRRHREAARFGSLEVEHQLVLGRRLHRQVGGLLALKDAIDVGG